ncbi:MAG: hypothetical protein PSW75_06000 [bacterium]|nr:hypothetical protein [bacterium]
MLVALTGCETDDSRGRSGYYDRPSSRGSVMVVYEDDYDYYPAYEVYYSRSRHEYVYRDGNSWVRRSEPSGISISVLLSTPSVRMDFRDSPEQHHSAVIRSYPRNWSRGGSGVQVQAAVVFEDDYIYYPGYEVYYSSNRHEYVYRDGSSWVRRSEPRGVSLNVLLAAPSVRMDFRDSPERHHSTVVQSYPRTVPRPPGTTAGKSRRLSRPTATIAATSRPSGATAATTGMIQTTMTGTSALPTKRKKRKSPSRTPRMGARTTRNPTRKRTRKRRTGRTVTKTTTRRTRKGRTSRTAAG